jgi:hypothetical protein
MAIIKIIVVIIIIIILIINAEVFVTLLLGI